MTKKVIVIGNGGREHAICFALSRSPQKPEIWNIATSINPGIELLDVHIEIVESLDDFEVIKNIAQKISATLIIPGPEAPLANGISDFCTELGIPCFGPTKQCAQLESSKSWTRNVLRNNGVADACPDYVISTEIEDGQRKEFFNKWDGQIVVKADGLLGGKGVVVAGDHFETFEAADAFAQKSIEKFGRVVLEEKLIGVEFSVLSVVDGETVLDFRACQDHKRVGEGDTGPQTGGMGVISDEMGSLPFLTEKDLELAHNITARSMKAVEKETGEKFVGIMYGGFIATKKGVQLIEYNVRFGDPEALNILATLETDFLDICEAACQQNLKRISKLEFTPLATVQKYLCAPGYPESPQKGLPIDFPETWNHNHAEVFFAGAMKKNGHLISTGGRVLGVVGFGTNLTEANMYCEKMIAKIKSDLFHRSDIGTEKLTQERIEMMKELRS
jgi:phosphoribosylamine--glycine ligase